MHHARMDEHIPLLLTISFLFLLATLPQSHCQEDDTTKYSDCSRPYSCGVVSNIYYPFWGHNRPHYCGSSDQLELICEESQVTSFQYGSQSFTVLNINTSANTMRMVRTDLAYDACNSSDLTNTSLSLSLFVYPQTVYNITIFYGCPLSLTNVIYNFTCQNDRNELAFYVEEEELNSEFTGYTECERCIEVQALREIPLDSGGGIDALRRAVAGGFEVKYNIADDEECIRCKLSKGACGVSTRANDQFSCHCPDGSDALQCYGHSANHNSMPSFPSCAHTHTN